MWWYEVLQQENSFSAYITIACHIEALQAAYATGPGMLLSLLLPSHDFMLYSK